MLRFKKLTEKNLLLYAAKHYSNPTFSDIEDFHEDLKRFKYIKNDQYTGITMDPTVVEALRKI